MSDDKKVVHLVPNTGVCEPLVEALEELLEKAKRGEVTDVLAVGLGLGSTPTFLYDPDSSIPRLMELVGLLETLKVKVINEALDALDDELLR